MNIALITARAGSKGIKGKNIKIFHGKPLIYWTISAAVDSKVFDEIYVSTDCSKVKDVAGQLKVKIIDRPRHLATDNASSEDVLLHCINHLEINSLIEANICLLQPTSPLRTARDISESFSVYRKTKADSVIGVYKPTQVIVKAYKENSDGSIEGLLSSNAPYMRRQDLPECYLPNGAIYWFNMRRVIEEKGFPKKNTWPYIMEEKYSIDIDTIDDFVLAEKTMEEL